MSLRIASQGAIFASQKPRVQGCALAQAEYVSLRIQNAESLFARREMLCNINLPCPSALHSDPKEHWPAVISKRRRAIGRCLCVMDLRRAGRSTLVALKRAGTSVSKSNVV